MCQTCDLEVMRERIVITGIGIVSAIGANAAECSASLKAQRSGIGSVRYLNTVHKEFPVGEVNMSNDEMAAQLGIAIAPHQPTPRTSLMGSMAIKEATSQAKLSFEENIALISGTTVGGMDMIEQHFHDVLDQKELAQQVAQKNSCGNSTEQMAQDFPFRMRTTVSTACSSALNSIIFGDMLLRSGRADAVVAGGSESLTRYHLNGFKSLMILDKQPCRPFDATRAGLNLGEGAAFLVLETEHHAKQRGANILAVLSGTGNRCDAFHQTASSDNGEGAYLAMTEALRTASLQPHDIGYVNAHGTGTSNNDASECEALMRTFGKQIPPFSSTKAYTGHTTSASGSIEAAFCVLALQEQFIPANLNWKYPMKNGLTPITSIQPAYLRHILCNAFGFGGNDSSVILSKYDVNGQ